MEPQYPWFKIKGISRLLSLQELKNVRGVENRCIRVVDLKTQKNWLTNYKTIISKFR